MARQSRVQDPGALYHERDRGDRREALRRVGWQEARWASSPKGPRVKVKVAGRLRQETTVTLAWIAQRLRMGAPGYVNHLLYRQRKAEAE